MKLTSDQIDVYRRDGVVPIGKVLDEAAVAEAKERIEALRQRDLLDNPAEQIGKKSFRMLNVSSVDEWFKSIINNDNVLDAAESVLGPNVQFFQDNIFWKPPKQGAPSTWHQDNIWWAGDPPNMLTIWIALDDADASNGGVHYIPGSQTKLLEGELDLDDPNAYSHRLLSDEQVDGSRAISFTVPAGHAVMHHCQTIHGAPPNQSDRSRCGYTVQPAGSGITGQRRHRMPDPARENAVTASAMAPPNASDSTGAPSWSTRPRPTPRRRPAITSARTINPSFNEARQQIANP